MHVLQTPRRLVEKSLTNTQKYVCCCNMLHTPRTLKLAQLACSYCHCRSCASSRPPPRAARHTGMKLFCWNVNSLVPTVRNVNLKYGSLAAFFAHLDADIVCMQEVKLPDSKLTKELVVVEGYQSYWACSQSKTGYSGVTTWVRDSWAASSADADPFSCDGCDKEGRAIVTDHGAFVLFNLYVPNAGDRPARARLGAKLSFLAAVRERVDDLLGAGRQVVLVGDFNIAAEKRDVHPKLSWDTMYDPAELTALAALTRPEGCACADTWRRLHPDTDGVYTVWCERTSAREVNVGLRIDYALVSSGLLGSVASSEVLLDLPPKWSDHAPLLLQLNLPAPYAASSPSAAATTAAAAAADGQTAEQAASQQQQQQQLPRPPECQMWRELLRRFQDPSQRRLTAMFKAAAGKQKPAQQQGAAAKDLVGAASAGKTAAAAAAGGGGSASGAAGAKQAGEAAGGCEDTAAAAAAAAAAASKQPSVDRPGDASAPGQPDSHAPAVAGAAVAAAAAAGQAPDPVDDTLQRGSQHPDQQQEGSEQQVQQLLQPQPPSQQQQQQRRRRVKSQGGGGSSKGSSSSSRQPAGAKRKASTSKPDTTADKGSKQAKLSSFFARAPSNGSKK